MCFFYFLYNFCPKRFSIKEELRETLLQMYKTPYIKQRYSCHILMEL
jgi:hypothetical protein